MDRQFALVFGEANGARLIEKLRGNALSHFRENGEMTMATTAVKKVLTVSELTGAIKETLDRGFGSVWVAGEISNYRPASSGHVYLTLKDAASQLRAVIWRGVAARL